jgi:large subunit ribosomal protein L4
VHGGIAHGPRNERDYSVKLNKKMKTKALFTVLSRKLKDGEIVFLTDLALRTPKTKEAKSVLSSIAKVKEFAGISRKKNAAFIALAEKDENAAKGFKNFGNLELGQVKDLSVVDLLQYRYLVMADPEKSLSLLSSRLK